jgi:hypothetical protein
MPQVVEHLLSKHMVLSSNPNIVKKKKKHTHTQTSLSHWLLRSVLFNSK